tara:strand:- start:25 stop:1134 length:1110 start_codon:yes stop_codon:yes gene_type:complete
MEKNKKKLIFFMPSMDGGGVEKNLVIIANYTSAYLDKVSLITFDNSFSNLFNKKINIIKVQKKNYQKKHKKYYKYFKCLMLLIKEFIKNRNILVFSFQANIYVLMLSSILGFKVISRSNSSPSGWNKSYIKNFIFKIFFNFADEIIVNSKDFKKEFLKKFRIKTKLIYNPLNKEEIIKKSKIKLNFNFFKSNKYLKIINVARFTDQKDHLTLLKSFKIINRKINSKLLILGYGANESKIINFIEKNKLRNAIKIISFKSNPYNYIKKSDLFVLTSKYEGLPNVILEAQTLKKFVISSNCPTGPKEILKNGKIGNLFKVGDHKKLANLIINFYKNRKKFNTKINQAYNDLGRFNYSKNCREYLNVIRKKL